MRFMVHNTRLAGVCVLERNVIGDNRGSFARLFDASDLNELGWSAPIAQVNHSVTAQQGTLRGMHFQRPPYADIKLVTCTRGSVFDVVLDVGSGSPTLGQWHGEVLSAENNRAMLIPAGFAHGFQALSDDVQLVYCHSAPYVPANDAAYNALDPLFSIAWPLPITEMSARDRAHAMIDREFKGVLF